MYRTIDDILLLDGTHDMSELLKEFLVGLGFLVHHESNRERALESLSERNFEILLITERIHGVTALEFAKKAVALSPDIYVILASSQEDIGSKIRSFHRRFRRLPVPLVLHDLQKIIQANTKKEEVS